MDLLHVRVQNEDATSPLVIPINVVANTPASKLFDNIRINSKNASKWLKAEKPHDGVALLCGSGGSIKNDLQKIKELKDSGATIFALNAACKFLNNNGIIPDYQFIIDAKPETKDLIGKAKEHIFGSTVDPECFGGYIAQLQIDNDELQDEIDHLAPHAYSMLGTGVSVGLVAGSLAYTLGFRDIHFFGYDSSHIEEKSHVIDQPMNRNMPCMEVEFGGRKFVSSLPMRMQAERFINVSNLLKDGGCNIEVHGDGLLPHMYNSLDDELSEKDKYQRLWATNSYRSFSPAEQIVSEIEKAIENDGTVFDFGCGTARSALALSRLGYDVLCIDFTTNSRDEDARHLPFLEWDLTVPMTINTKYGYCVDVLEHIEPENVDKVLSNIMNAAETVFFQISTIDDSMGELIGKTLHLSVHPMEWWINRFKTLGFSVIKSEESSSDCKLIVENKNVL